MHVFEICKFIFSLSAQYLPHAHTSHIRKKKKKHITSFTGNLYQNNLPNHHQKKNNNNLVHQTIIDSNVIILLIEVHFRMTSYL